MNQPPKLAIEKMNLLKSQLTKRFALQVNMIEDFDYNMKLVLYRILKNEQLLKDSFEALAFVSKRQGHLRRLKKSISTRRICKFKKHWFQKIL